MKENFNKKILDNGFTILHEKRDVPVVSLSVTVKSGGLQESLDEKGISHYIEHTIFKGTTSRASKNIYEEIESVGGELNAFTAETVTSFWFKMPAAHLNVALDVMADIVKHPKFDPEELEKERKVIFEEIKMRRDSPHHYVFDKIQGMLYTGTLAADLIGTEESMNKIGRDELMARFKRMFKPDNMIFTVVGDCEFEDLVQWAEENFGGEEKSDIPEYEIGLKNDTVIEERAGIDQANMIFAYHSPLAADPLSYAEHILIILMTGGFTSRLHEEIREKRNLAYAVHGDVDCDKRYAHSVIYAGTTVEKMDKVKEIILEEYKKVADSLTEEELQAVKGKIIGNHQISMEDSQSQMVHLMTAELETGAEDFYEYEKKINEVKLEDVKMLAGKVTEGNYSFFALVPNKS